MALCATEPGILTTLYNLQQYQHGIDIAVSQYSGTILHFKTIFSFCLDLDAHVTKNTDDIEGMVTLILSVDVFLDFNDSLYFLLMSK